MPRPWVLKKVRKVALSPSIWPNLDTPHASQLLSCRIVLPCGGGGSVSPSKMSEAACDVDEPRVAWRLRRFENLLAAKIPMSRVNAACSFSMIQKPKRIKIKKQKKGGGGHWSLFLLTMPAVKTRWPYTATSLVLYVFGLAVAIHHYLSCYTTLLRIKEASDTAKRAQE